MQSAESIGGIFSCGIPKAILIIQPPQSSMRFNGLNWMVWEIDLGILRGFSLKPAMACNAGSHCFQSKWTCPLQLASFYSPEVMHSGWARFFLSISQQRHSTNQHCFVSFRWRGSIYKLVWLDLVCFLFLYYFLNLIYRTVLDQEQKL